MTPSLPVSPAPRASPSLLSQVVASRVQAAAFSLLLLVAVSFAAAPTRGDEPYAPSRDYNLENVRTHLWFDVDRREVKGEVTESVALLRDSVTDLKFDSVGLTIAAVTVDGKSAKFSTDSKDLRVSLESPGKVGDRHEVFIQYHGQPKAGLFFVLPDEHYPNQPREIWTQGEAEDTHYYIPIYDYPNDRTTSEMILTVPASWLTVSNGRLLSVHDESNGMRAWDWKESQPISTYLISAVAGEFIERDDSWHGLPLRYVVPRGKEADIDLSFSDTKRMLDLFSDKLGVPFPWEQYAQTSVDEFTAGGMENASATTLPVPGLLDPRMAAEYHTGADNTHSHELAHQWFGDLVTCKDWANLWLNEGFATYFQTYWLEAHYSPDEAAYEFWRTEHAWFRQTRLYPVPIVDRNFTDSTEYAGNIYNKGAWILKMLRTRLGDAAFFGALHQYLEDNRGKNVVTADLEKAIEKSASVNTDRFFDQWVYRAGAPRFTVQDSYDPSKKTVTLSVAQTQQIAGPVGVFDVPVTVEITTATGRHSYPIEIDQATETFSFPADAAPLMILFDKGDQVLKSVEFHRDPARLIYQLKSADSVPDRADAAVALGSVGDNPDVVAALGDAAHHDSFWGVRAEALRALGRLGGSDAERQVLASLDEQQAWVRDVVVAQLGKFTQDGALGRKLEQIAGADPAYRVRAAALRAIAELHAPNAFDVLLAAIHTDSPNDILRSAALGALGHLPDDRAVPVLLEWSAPGKPLTDRQAAIESVAALQVQNKEITRLLVSCLHEPYFDIRMAAIFALGQRGDPDAISPLEEVLHGDTLSIGERPHIEFTIAALKKRSEK